MLAYLLPLQSKSSEIFHSADFYRLCK